jgi:hypothetical protein
LRQIVLSWLYFLANAIKDGSIIPPRSLKTRCNVDSIKFKTDLIRITHSNHFFIHKVISYSHNFSNKNSPKLTSYYQIENFTAINSNLNIPNLSGCYSQQECDHPPTVFRRRSTSAGPEEFLENETTREELNKNEQ